MPCAQAERERAEAGYGSKTIGTKSSICLIINNIMGPAMVALPYLTQRAGWMPLIMVNLICCLCSGLSSAMLSEALQRIPGNFFFLGDDPETGQRYEFCDVVRYYWGTRWGLIVRILFNVSLQAQNIPAMVVSCQVLDDFLQQATGHVYGIQYDVFPLRFDHGDPNNQFIVTSGVVVCMLICIPFGCLNLDQNKIFQNASFGFLFLLTLEFMVQFTIIGPFVQDRPLVFSRTLWATDKQAKTLGVILFSWCFPSTLPSWLNEKGPRVKVTSVVWFSCIFGFFCKVLIAVFGAWAYELSTRTSEGTMKDRQDAQNILLVMDHVTSSWLTKASAYAFSFTTLIPGIPVIAVIVRYNLLSSGGFGKVSASFFGVVLPWILTVLLYRTELFVDALNWAAMLCMGPVNFIIPPLIFISAVRRFPSDSPSRAPLGWEQLGRRIADHSLASGSEIEVDCSYVLSGEKCTEAEEALIALRNTTAQASIVAVPQTLRVNRARLAQLIAITMATLVTATVLFNVYYLVIFREDIVD